MLHHGVEESKVDQILIRPEVVTAIEDGEGDVLQKHQDKTGFGSIVREQVQRLSARSLGARIAKAAVALEDIDQEFLPASCWELLTEGIEAVREIEVRSAKVGKGLDVLLGIQESQTDREPLERKTLRLISPMPD